MQPNVRISITVDVDGVVKTFSASGISGDVVPERVAKALARAALIEATNYLSEKITDRLYPR